MVSIWAGSDNAGTRKGVGKENVPPDHVYYKIPAGVHVVLGVGLENNHQSDDADGANTVKI